MKECQSRSTGLGHIVSLNKFHLLVAKKQIVPMPLQPKIRCEGRNYYNESKRHCSWIHQCVMRIDHMPGTWWETSLQDANSTCKNGSGVCVLRNARLPTLSRRGCTAKGRSVWVKAYELVDYEAVCVRNRPANTGKPTTSTTKPLATLLPRLTQNHVSKTSRKISEVTTPATVATDKPNHDKQLP